jgi:hypothetical protein
VAKTHPDKFIGTLAYEGYYWTPKSFEMEKNTAMTPCMHTKFWSSSPTYFKNELKKWEITSAVDREMYIQLTFSEPQFISRSELKC